MQINPSTELTPAPSQKISEKLWMDLLEAMELAILELNIYKDWDRVLSCGHLCQVHFY